MSTIFNTALRIVAVIIFTSSYVWAEEPHHHANHATELGLSVGAAHLVEEKESAPGLALTEHDGESEKKFMTHIELTYEFDFHTFGLGPVVGVALSEDDTHYMIGIHFGRAF